MAQKKKVYKERVVRQIYELRIKFYETDRPLLDFINEQRAHSRATIPAQAYVMLKFAAAQMSAHDLESMKQQ